MLHGNRTYLLQDDDGQIIEAHSISAGLDYPGIGPEHAWLADTGRVNYVSATDKEALEAFQLCCRLEGIIPALEPAHALAHVMKIAPELPADHLLVMNMCGRGDKDVFTVAERPGSGRCERRPPRAPRFAELAQRRAAPGWSPMSRPAIPISRPSREIALGLPAAGADVIELGMPFTDPMADGPAIQVAGQRALKAGMTLRKTLAAGARLPRAGDDDDADRADGLLQPDLQLRQRGASWRTRSEAGVDGLIIVDLPPEEDDELCLPALEAGLNWIRLATPTTDDARLPAVLDEHLGLRLLRLDHRHHRRPRRGGRRCRQGGPAAEAAIPTCRSPSVSASRRRTRPRTIARVADAAVVGSAFCQTGGREPGRAAAGPGSCLRRTRSSDLARATRPRASAEGAGMNWLTNLSLPKIRDLVRKTETPENLWDKCPDCEQMIFHRDLEAAMNVCPHCGFHMRIAPSARLACCSTTAATARIELPEVLVDPLRFRDRKRYSERLRGGPGRRPARRTP